MAAAAVYRTGRFESNGLTTYLREIAAYPLLSRSREVELAALARAGDSAARESLICANLRFVVSQAKRYRNQGVAFEDLINAGNLGLVRAIQRFDETRGHRFITYAVWWIRQAMFEVMADGSNAVRLPQDRDVDVPAPISLDATRDDAGVSLLELLPDERASAPHESIETDSVLALLATAIERLPEREHMVVTRYFGLGGVEAETLDGIAARIGVSRERAMQIKERAIRRLRSTKQGRGIAVSLA